MGGNYEKGLYNQLMDVMERLSAMESDHKQDRREIKRLNLEVGNLHRENTCLIEEISDLKQKNAALEKSNDKLYRNGKTKRTQYFSKYYRPHEWHTSYSITGGVLVMDS